MTGNSKNMWKGSLSVPKSKKRKPNHGGQFSQEFVHSMDHKVWRLSMGSETCLSGWGLTLTYQANQWLGYQSQLARRREAVDSIRRPMWGIKFALAMKKMKDR